MGAKQMGKHRYCKPKPVEEFTVCLTRCRSVWCENWLTVWLVIAKQEKSL